MNTPYKVFTPEQLRDRVKLFISLMINQSTANNITIKIDNGRMTNTYGYCYSDNDNTYLKFSSMLLDGRYTLESVDSVLKHEIGHLLDILDRGYSNHDKHFHAIANKYKFHGTSGVELNKSEIYDTIVKIEKKQPKYRVVCNSCGQIAGDYYNKTAAIKSIERNENVYSCKRCSSRDLEIVYL